MIEDLREDFLKRELEKLCGLSDIEELMKFGEEDLEVTSSPVVYTQTDYENGNGLKLLDDPSQG